MKEFANKFIDFIHKSPNNFFAVYNTKEILEKNKYTELKVEDKWDLKNNKYYVKINESAIVAFEIGKGDIEKDGFRIVASHTDSPSIKIKPQSEIQENNYLKLNIEIYGGPILNTWLDRPLSISGRVYTRGENSFSPKLHLININRPLLIIPNLAIHQNREVNKGYELNKQIDMLPLIALIEDNFEKDKVILSLLAKEIGINQDDILDFELYLHEFEKGQVLGLNEEFISASRIDNLASVYASTSALVNSDSFKGIKVMVAFDNEEIGSRTRQGADSLMLSNLLEKIVYSLNKGKDEYFRALENSFMLSVDGAHAIHPNQASKTDITNKPMINKGIVIKYNANFSYTSDALSSSIIKELARKNSIKLQYFVNRSDLAGGSTIGPLSAKYLPIKSIDIGLPMLAMHSIRELCGIEDLDNLTNLIKKFFSEN